MRKTDLFWFEYLKLFWFWPKLLFYIINFKYFYFKKERERFLQTNRFSQTRLHKYFKPCSKPIELILYHKFKRKEKKIHKSDIKYQNVSM